MRIISDVEQGTPEWLEFRRNKIGASDAPVIMGVSPWKSIGKLFDEKIGMKDCDPSNIYQERGLMLEDSAREYFFLITGYEVKPDVFTSEKYDWMIASVDGISADKKILVEIKCPGEKDHDLASLGIIPEKYFPQLQHQLEVLNLNKGYYLSFSEEEVYIIPFYRDQDYINKMIKAELEFYHCLENFTPPKRKSRMRRNR